MNLLPQAAAVIRALGAIDGAVPGETIPINEETKAVIESVLSKKKGGASDKVALLYLLAYKAEVPDWDLRHVPTGWRPHDKLLAGHLTDRNLTLHGNITAFAENMGIKGDVKGYDLFTGRARLGPALQHVQNSPEVLDAALKYVAQRFKDSYAAPAEVAKLSPEELVYTKALAIAHQLIYEESRGHFPQFLVAGLLRAFHEQFGTASTIRTAHPNASDTSGRVAGDVEVVGANGEIQEGYEVTVRPDWRNRRADLTKKMHAFGLSRYTVICLLDSDIADPESLHDYMAELGEDIAVVDIREFVATMLQLLDRQHRRLAFRYLEEYVRDRDLCGIPDLIERLNQILEEE